MTVCAALASADHAQRGRSMHFRAQEEFADGVARDASDGRKSLAHRLEVGRERRGETRRSAPLSGCRKRDAERVQHQARRAARARLAEHRVDLRGSDSRAPRVDPDLVLAAGERLEGDERRRSRRALEDPVRASRPRGPPRRRRAGRIRPFRAADERDLDRPPILPAARPRRARGSPSRPRARRTRR